MREVKVGIIGTGFIGPVHIEALRRLGFVKIEALAEANEELAKEKAAEFNISKYYGDYRELLADEEIEVIHNCTPNFLHYQINKEAIKAGKHVVSEKPLSMTSVESQELLELARENNVYHAVNFNYRQYPVVQEIRNRIKQKDMGDDIYLIRGYYIQDWLLYDTDYNWRVEKKKGGSSRAVADIGSHWCDLAQHLSGQKIVEVYAHLKTVLPVRKKPRRDIETFKNKEEENIDYEEIKVDTEDYATVLLKFANGAVGSFTVSQVSAGHKNDLFIEINGTKKSYSWSQEKANELVIGYRDKPNEVLVKDPALLCRDALDYAYYPGGHVEGWSEGVKNMLNSFYRCLLEKGDPENYSFATFADGHYENRLVEAILESTEKDRWVKV
ncbi:MAG: hypothetical protein PWR10_1202 [Halanaerobiales bacterium]|nr:hypothetical protein [Halanaerobiales bacterium]